jgi:hypothetical protein
MITKSMTVRPAGKLTALLLYVAWFLMYGIVSLIDGNAVGLAVSLFLLVFAVFFWRSSGVQMMVGYFSAFGAVACLLIPLAVHKIDRTWETMSATILGFIMLSCCATLIFAATKGKNTKRDGC